jgi:hypothetical protein
VVTEDVIAAKKYPVEFVSGSPEPSSSNRCTNRFRASLARQAISSVWHERLDDVITQALNKLH